MLRLTHLIDQYNRTKRGISEPLMTQRRLANITGLNEATVHRHVTGKTSLDLEQALAYSHALQCTVEELVGADHDAA